MKNFQIIGYDINDSFVQISYQDQTMKEPDTLYLTEDSQGTELPLLMSFNREEKKWYTPIDNSEFEKWENDNLYRNMLTHCLENNTLTIDEESIKPSELIFIYISKTLERLLANKTNLKNTFIVFTIPSVKEEFISLLQNIGERIGFDKDKVYVQDYKESFYDYVCSQAKEISNYDVVLFGFREHNLFAYKITKGQIAGSRRRDYVSISEDQIENVTFDKFGDSNFENFARIFFGRSLVSSVFLVGDEFNENWYDGTLGYICNGRHVFQGKNLYSKGACNAALRKSGLTTTNLIYIDEFKTLSKISIRLSNQGVEEWYPILKQGENWYEVKRSIEVLVDQVQSINIRIDTIGRSMPREEYIPLDGLFEKQRRTCRLDIKIVMYSSDICKLVVEDKDFGEIMKASGYHLEHMIVLEEGLN